MSMNQNDSNSTTVSVPALLKKTEHYDKDERYMATSDLCEVLKRQADSVAAAAGSGSSSTRTTSANSSATTTTTTSLQQSPSQGRYFMDTTQEQQVCTAVLRLLHDKSNDVQAIAVKTLGVLLTTVQATQVLEIADSLADQVLDASKSELRDVYAIGLRTLVKTVPASVGDRVSQRLVGRLLDGIRSSTASAAAVVVVVDKNDDDHMSSSNNTNNNNEEITLACLDILTELLTRFGASCTSITRQHEPMLQMCLALLSSSPQQQQQQPSAVIRKRAGTTMGCLSVVLSDALLTRMVEALLTQIDMAAGVGKEGRRKTLRAHQQQPQYPAATAAGDTRALIRTMCTVSGAVGHRLGQEQIDRILPIFLRFTDPEDAVTGDDAEDDDDDGADEEPGATAGGGGGDQDVDMVGPNDDEAALALANELRESCFMGFESFILRCPKEVEPHLNSIIQAALAYMSYDPNYSYGVTDEDDDNDDDMGGSGDEEFEEEFSDEEYDEDDEDEDDEDDSWKVRRSAIRALNAVVTAMKHDPAALWTVSYSIRKGKSDTLASAILSRFKEREENCRVEVIDCFTQLVVALIEAGEAGSVNFATVEDAMDISSSNVTNVAFEGQYTPKLIKACEKILAIKKGNEKSKSSVLSLLSTLCRAPGGIGNANAIASVLKKIQVFLSSKDDHAMHREGTSKALRLDALTLVHAILSSSSHDASSVRKSLREDLLPQLCLCVKEQWYKVIAEALRALAEAPRIFVEGYPDDYDAATKETERTEVATMLFDAIEPLLATHDVDQEIKECALKACASLLSSLSASLSETQTSRLLELLLVRLQNETTRVTAIKTLATVAASSRTDLSPILAESISSMASFLKYQSRSLKQNALECLDVVITNHGTKSAFQDGELYSSVLLELAPLIVASDLHLTHLSLQVTVSILKVCPAAGPAVKHHVLEHALSLSTSSLLQDHALDSLLDLWKQIIESNAVDFKELLELLNARLTTELSRTGIYNLAKCIARASAATTHEKTGAVLEDMLQLIEATNLSTEESAIDDLSLRKVQLSLLVTGDLGRIVDLSSFANSADRLKSEYERFFDSNSDDLKQAAAYALGNASVGSQSVFLQEIVQKIGQENKKHQYLLLSALREFIRCGYKYSKSDIILPTVPVIIAPLETLCGDAEEGIRTMVAECMGSLSCLQPGEMLPKLEKLVRDHSAIATEKGMVAEGDAASTLNSCVGWTVATSVKLAIAGKVDPAALMASMPTFVQLLNQEELNVRTAALLMVYSAAHHMPQAISGLLKTSILPALFDVAKLKLERKVDLGPFTHTVDDALPLRKAALSIFATCLENLPGSIDMSTFMPVLAKSLGDAEDIQLHAHQIIISMCSRQPEYLVASVESFVEPLEKTMNKKAGQKTGTELERLNDWIKSALRVMIALSKLEGAMNSRKFADFCERVKGNNKFTDKIRAIEAER